MLALAVGVGCGAWTERKTAATEKAAADIARCALDAYAEDPQVTAAGLTARCAGLVVEEAGRILLAARRVRGPSCAASASASASH